MNVKLMHNHRTVGSYLSRQDGVLQGHPLWHGSARQLLFGEP
jgi:hypothetical protein